MDQSTEKLLAQYQSLMDAACVAGREQLERSGFDTSLMPSIETFSFERQPDPFTQQETLNGRWGEDQGQRRANLVINADGSLLMECDLLCPHPRHEGRWAEQVSIWGRDAGNLQAEISLLAELEG